MILMYDHDLFRFLWKELTFAGIGRVVFISDTGAAAAGKSPGYRHHFRRDPFFLANFAEMKGTEVRIKSGDIRHLIW